MLKTMQGAFAAFFGPSHNEKYAELLKKLSEVGIACARHMHATAGQDLPAIIEFEHRADRITDEVHELLDNSFIMRFDIPDAMKLSDDLDDVVDGMRKVALHIDAYRTFLAKMPPEAIELMALSIDMLLKVDSLIAMLAEPRLSLARVRAVADAVDGMEATADKLVAAYERKLVDEFSKPGAIGLGFIAWHQLFHLLEQITDDANHCAKMVLSLARKEA